MIIVKKPKIRFKGFTETWEQRKLDEVITRIGTGLNPRDNFTLNSGGENYYVTIKNFVHGHLSLDDNCDKVDDEALKRIQERSDLCVNDILFTSIGRIGDCYLIKKQPTNWNINESVFTLRPNLTLVEPEYIYHTIHSDAVLNQIINGITGSTFKSIKIADLKKVNIPVPSKAEQKQIAAFISIIDHLITLHQRKCENLKKLKKFMLQKMFPQNGENVPKIRFYNFTDTWEQRKLFDFTYFYNGLTYTPDDVRENGTLVLRSSNVKHSEIVLNDNVYVDPIKVNSEYVKKGDIIIVVRNGSRALIGKHAVIKDEMPNTVIGAFMSGIRSQYSFFVNSLLDTSQFKEEILRNLGATINQITGYMFSKMEFMIPSCYEQKIIGDYFSKLDNLITLHQSKCDNLKELKKYMLQNMFI